MYSSRKLNIGVVGCGYWGPKIIRNLADLSTEGVIGDVTICDLSEERLATLVERHPALHSTTEYHDLLRDSAIDAIVIATPIRTHHRLATAALQAGKHVLVEKPLTASVDESERLVELADSVDRVLMVGHTFQYNPAVEKLRDLVASGELGQVYYIDCARLNLGLFQGDINVMWDLAPHDVSILLHILGRQPESVSAHGVAHVLDGVDDVAHVSLRFAGGVHAHLRLSWLDPVKVRRVTVVGSEKMAVFSDTSDERLKVFDRRVALTGEEEYGRPVFDYHDGDVEAHDIEEGEPLRAQICHFIECIQTGRRPISDGRVGLEVVRVLEAADRSRRQDGRWINLRPSVGSATGATSGEAVTAAGLLESGISKVGA